MSRMLNLIGAGWDSVLSSAAHGRGTETLKQLRCLLAHPELPSSVACKAYRMAGELSIEAEQYSRARRYFRSAAGIAPSNPETYHLWGLAYECDPHGCDRHAARLFRKASLLEPENPKYRAAFGRAAVRSGSIKRGVRELMAAASAARGEVAVIRVITQGLIEAGRFKDARAVLNKARFLCFQTGKGKELETLMELVRFEFARSAQREITRHRLDADYAMDGGRVVLPFVRIADSTRKPTKSAGNGSQRRDVVSLPRPHFPQLCVERDA